jgi:hypothetical protein
MKAAAKNTRDDALLVVDINVTLREVKMLGYGTRSWNKIVSPQIRCVGQVTKNSKAV